MAYIETERAVKELIKLDPIMGAHIKRTGECDIAPKGSGGPSHFETLAREITFQQLAGKAASTIWGRTRALVKGRFTADAVLALDETAMRGAGLSQNKMLSIRDLAQHVVDGQLPFNRLKDMSDEAVIEHLVQVRGIGEWTAQMFLIFRLYRLDVWPTGDLGVRNGYKSLYGLAESPKQKEFGPMGDKFSPYRSLAAWYCWRAADTVVPDEPDLATKKLKPVKKSLKV